MYRTIRGSHMEVVTWVKATMRFSPVWRLTLAVLIAFRIAALVIA